MQLLIMEKIVNCRRERFNSLIIMFNIRLPLKHETFSKTANKCTMTSFSLT